MRRQTQSQGLAARWQAKPLDINPFQLPARFALNVRGKTGGLLPTRDHVTIQPHRVAIEREILGARVNGAEHRVEQFSGVAIRIDTLGDDEDSFAVSVNLHHEDPELCIPLHIAFDMNDASARWQAWGRALRLPLLLPAQGGGWREPVERLGALIVDRAFKRGGRLSLKDRRSFMAATRGMGHHGPLASYAAQEIIARA